MNRTLQVLKYVLADLVAAALAWGLFYMYRKKVIEPQKFGHEIPVQVDQTFIIGLICIPIFWLILYTVVGSYRDIYRKSRLKELAQTLWTSFLGVLTIFFALILDDEVASYKSYYRSFLFLLTLHFTLTFLLRFILTSITSYRIKHRKIGFPTILIGSNQKAVDLFQEFESMRHAVGNRFIGYVQVNGGNGGSPLKENIPHLGHVDNLREIIEQNKAEEVIIAIESSEHDNLRRIMDRVEGMGIVIKIIPDMYDILAGSVKMTSIFGAALIEIYPDLMPHWQKFMKRAMDITISLGVLVFCAPLYILTALAVKISSKGPVFYSHERIGQYGKPFTIYKFRSMYVNAEKDKPMLASENDSRITPLGSFMRKTRLDEIPQFYNVLIGDMSLVGPRPERQYFIDQIVMKAEHYHHLHKVRPGITSWGQVKYGYAENVEQMIERLKYDIIYIENMSLALDLKIIGYTVLTVVQGRGK
ncbi:MAG: sugar transferase [Flavobacteriales bacterium]|nr:sugar transferase [Flavobacteriales bacterium]MCB9448240.1 sugar transferase [Flavobacteriales bacterium]